METVSIIDFVQRRLADDKRSTYEIADAAQVKQRWLHNLRCGKVPRPGAHLIDKLAQHYGFYEEREAVDA